MGEETILIPYFLVIIYFLMNVTVTFNDFHVQWIIIDPVNKIILEKAERTQAS